MVELLSGGGLGDRRRLIGGDVASSTFIVEIGTTVEMSLIGGLPVVNGSILIGFAAAGRGDGILIHVLIEGTGKAFVAETS